MDIFTRNVPDALYEVLYRLTLVGIREESRNGPVLSYPVPITVTITEPTQRVLTCPIRDANPFFHIAETVWMLGGGQGLEFIQYFNSGMAKYSDDGKTLHGAYGHRWRQHFFRDQIVDTVNLLRKDPTTRRAVIAMWDAEVDGGDGLDLPCNLSICFRMVDLKLDMTVYNRSNDIIWGMLGANAVHMTYLHELIAAAIRAPVGLYRVVSNNLHTYLGNPQTSALMGLHGAADGYRHRGHRPYPILFPGEDYLDVLAACKKAVALPWENTYDSIWMKNVFCPMRDAYVKRKKGLEYKHDLENIQPDDWRTACQEWCQRREDNE